MDSILIRTSQDWYQVTSFILLLHIKNKDGWYTR